MTKQELTNMVAEILSQMHGQEQPMVKGSDYKTVVYQNDIENLASLLTMAGCNYFMGIPHGDDIMLNYQTTGFRETAALRELTGKTAIPEFQRWLEKMGFVENGRLTAKAGDGSSLLF